jgi:hypothetical protein
MTICTAPEALETALGTPVEQLAVAGCTVPDQPAGSREVDEVDPLGPGGVDQGKQERVGIDGAEVAEIPVRRRPGIAARSRTE